MRTSEQFTRADLIRILNLSEKRLSQWEKLEFVARKDHYDFRDLIAVRTAKQLIENGVSPDRLRRSLRALSEKLTEVHAPLNELRITANGKDVIVEHSGGSQLEPLSGQFVMTFKTKELSEKVFTMPENPDAVFLSRAGIRRRRLQSRKSCRHLRPRFAPRTDARCGFTEPRHHCLRKG